MIDWDIVIKEIKKKRTDVENVLFVKMEDLNPTIFSKKRREILKILKKRKIKSETHLAEILGRQRENVVADLKLLEYYGLVERKRTGNKVIPRATKTDIVIMGS